MSKSNRFKSIKLIYKKSCLSEDLRYHIDNKISILDNAFRPTSNKYFQIIAEAKVKVIKEEYLNKDEMDIIYNSDIGKFASYNGEEVPLDFPLPEEDFFEKEAAKRKKDKSPKLNRPTRSSGPKKYKVYIRDPKSGNIRKINFGDKKGGLKLNIHDAAARKSFVARHKCKEKKDKTKAGYWACRVGRYPHLVGGKKRYTWW